MYVCICVGVCEYVSIKGCVKLYKEAYEYVRGCEYVYVNV